MNKKTGIYTVAIVALLLILVVGYAALQTTLNITGTTTVAKNNWDIHFENITTNPNSNPSSIEQAAAINDSKIGVDFEVTLSLPGQYYEFYVDVVNAGTIDAKLDSIIKTSLSPAQEKYLNYYVTYSDGGEVKKNDFLEKGTSENLKVTVEFQQDPVELPASETTIALSANLIYVQNDDNGVSRNTNILSNVLKENAVMDNIASTYVTSSSGVNLGAISSDTNGKGVYTLASTANNANPIYYYRGAVTNNNVIFANFCWKMIRTTDTGGVKLIYNGTPTNGECNATGADAAIGKSAFNTQLNDIKFAGYTYDDGAGNQTNSTVKTIIDNWYINTAHLDNYLSYLEDTSFYNERDGVAGDGITTTQYSFSPRVRMLGTSKNDYAGSISQTTIKLGATNISDKYTKSQDNGNGLLQYSIGMITTDEIILAGGNGYNIASDSGFNNNFYLNSNIPYWTISPSRMGGPGNFILTNIGTFGDPDVNNTAINVRPVISLKQGTSYTQGTGTTNDPYVVA